MDRTPNSSQTTSTAKAVGFAFLIVGGYWLAFGGLMNYVIRTQSETPVAQRLPPPDPTGRVLQAGLTPGSVKYRNIELVPLGAPLEIDKSQLAFLGQSDEGYGLWTVRNSNLEKARAGGGGGNLAPRGLPAATGPVYLRVADGTWQQVVQRGD